MFLFITLPLNSEPTESATHCIPGAQVGPNMKLTTPCVMPRPRLHEDVSACTV